jgi:ABC-type transport system involved in multi-copper enzyme maturation permease subunit
MSSIVPNGAGWLERHLSWSNSRQSWIERFCGLALLGAAVVLVLLGPHLRLSQQVVLWGLLVVAAAALLRRGWLKLLGPVFFYDLIRTARRGRYVLLRCGYAGLLAFVLFWMAWLSLWRVDARGGIPANRMTNLAETFFTTFIFIQFGAIMLFTPGYVAGAIAEEKERRTLEYLLATDLRNREIVLGKLASRLLNLTLLILTGLPILSFLELMGGVDPNLLLSVFVATGLTMLSLAALSILASTLVKRARDAIVLTYLGMVAYLVFSALSLLLLQPSWNVAAIPLTWGESPLTVRDLVDWLTAGNIFVLWGKLQNGIFQHKPLEDLLPQLMRNYAIFHGLMAAACSVWAVTRMRPLALRQMHDETRRRSWRIQFWRRPRVGQSPMVWKEVIAERGMRLHWLGWAFGLTLFVASFVPVAFILFNRWTRGRLAEEMNIWVRIIGTGVACLLLLGVAVRAATSISSERDRQTWDSLLTTCLDSDAILGGKWLGSLLSMRLGWAWLGLICVVGLATTGLHPVAVPVLLLAWFVYAAFVAGVGLWFSMTARTTLRSVIYTLLTVAGVTVGHWLPCGCCVTVVERGAMGMGRGFESLLKFELLSLTPPVTLGFLAFNWRDLDHVGGNNEVGELAAWCVAGIVLYAVAAAVLWGANSVRFAALTHRTRLRPEVDRPPRPRRPPADRRPRPAVRHDEPDGAEERRKPPAEGWTALPAEEEPPPHGL